MNIIVGVSDMKVNNEVESTIVTYSLGSCIGIAIYDSVARVTKRLSIWEWISWWTWY